MHTCTEWMLIKQKSQTIMPQYKLGTFYLWIKSKTNFLLSKTTENNKVVINQGQFTDY